MTYDDLRGNIMAYEQIHINRYKKYDKKKRVAFIVYTSDVGDEADENQDERMTLITRGVRKMLKQRRQRPQHDFKKMTSEEMTIVVTIVENQDILNKTI